MAKKITQPAKEQEGLLNDVLADSVDKVAIPGTKRTYNVRWMKWGTRRKITQIMESKKEGDEILFLYKAVACIILNGYWKIWFLYPILWRWLAYIK